MSGQVVEARALQTERFAKLATRNNAQMSSKQIRDSCRLDAACHDLLKSAVNEMGLSARAHDKVLRVARTIADLEQAETIAPPHIHEAINYRMLDRQMWT